MLRKKINANEVVIYNYNLQNQDINLLYRGKDIPGYLREYKKLWKMTDPKKLIDTIIISV